jgi:hypothetical protein
MLTHFKLHPLAKCFVQLTKVGKMRKGLHYAVTLLYAFSTLVKYGGCGGFLPVQGSAPAPYFLDSISLRGCLQRLKSAALPLTPQLAPTGAASYKGGLPIRYCWFKYFWFKVPHEWGLEGAVRVASATFKTRSEKGCIFGRISVKKQPLSTLGVAESKYDAHP